MQLHADWAITLACGASCPYVPTTVEDWDIDDPSGKPIEEVRVIRDEVEHQGHRPDRQPRRRDPNRPHSASAAPGAAAPDLVAEFGVVKTPEEIRACTDMILAGYGDAPVRSFTMTLANRRARECLRAEVCEPWPVGA